MKELDNTTIYPDNMQKEMKRYKITDADLLTVFNERKRNPLCVMVSLYTIPRKTSKNLMNYLIALLSIALVITAYIFGHSKPIPQKPDIGIHKVNYSKTLDMNKDTFLENLQDTTRSYDLYFSNQIDENGTGILKIKLDFMTSVTANLSDDDSIYDIRLDGHLGSSLIFENYLAAVIKAENMSLSEDEVTSIITALTDSEEYIYLLKDGRLYEAKEDGPVKVYKISPEW